jgi:dethiobiotin synthetase
MTALFITGSGTDVGKTFVTALLARQLRGAGRAVRALKPVVSGFDPAAAGSSDPGLLLDAAGLAVSPENLEAVAPWRFKARLSPDMAAAREGRTIDFNALLAFCQEAIDGAAEGDLLIEGVGGVVTGSYLGALSHCLTAVEALSLREIPVAGVIVSESEGSPVMLDETAAALDRFLPKVPVLALPRLADFSEAPDLTAALGLGLPAF